MSFLWEFETFLLFSRNMPGGQTKYVPKFYIGGTGHVISRMRNDDLHWRGTLEPNISKTLGDRGLVPMEHYNRKHHMGNRIVT